MSILQKVAWDQIPWSQVLSTTGVLAACYGCYVLFVRPFLHPLRKVPGLPYRPIIGNIRVITKGEAMESTINMIEKYGPIIRYYFFFGSERLLVACPDTMKHILVTNCKNYIKPPGRLKMFRMVLGDGLVLLEGNEHAAHKRLMSPSFNNSSIKSMLPAFEEAAKKLGDFWEKGFAAGEDGGIAQVQMDLSRTTLDVIGKTAFGYDFNSLEDPNEAVAQAFQDVLSGAGLNWRMAFPFYFDLPFPDARRFRSRVALMHNKVMQIVQAKREKLDRGEHEDVCGDLLDIMMTATDQYTGEGLSDDELKNEVMTLMSAGHETTSTAMAWFLLTMAQHPDIQQKCREEALANTPSSQEKINESLDNMPYLANTIKETLRMYAPVPLTLRQALEDDIYADKYHVPAGTIVLLAIGPMMRSPDLFKDPNTFNPDRFNDFDSNSTLYSYLPFLIGPRMCLGYKFALLEMRTIVASLLRRFTFSLVPGTSYKRKSRMTMRPDPALTLRVEKYKEK